MKAIIAKNMREAHAAAAALGMKREDVLLLAPGAATHAVEINDLLLVGWHPGVGDTPLLVDQGIEWFMNSVKTRLPPQRYDAVYIPSIDIIEI